MSQISEYFLPLPRYIAENKENLPNTPNPVEEAEAKEEIIENDENGEEMEVEDEEEEEEEHSLDSNSCPGPGHKAGEKDKNEKSDNKMKELTEENLMAIGNFELFEIIRKQKNVLSNMEEEMKNKSQSDPTLSMLKEEISNLRDIFLLMHGSCFNELERILGIMRNLRGKKKANEEIIKRLKEKKAKLLNDTKLLEEGKLQVSPRKPLTTSELKDIYGDIFDMFPGYGKKKKIDQNNTKNPTTTSTSTSALESFPFQNQVLQDQNANVNSQTSLSPDMSFYIRK